MTIRVTIGNGPAIIAALAAQLARIVGLEGAANALGARAAALEAGRVSKAGDTMNGVLNMGGNRVEAAGPPDSDDDLVPRGYMNAMVFNAIVSALSHVVAKSGDTMSGPLNMGGSRIEALGAPDSDDDAISRGYMNTAVFSAIVSAVAGLKGGDLPDDYSTILKIATALADIIRTTPINVAALEESIRTQAARIDTANAAIADIVRVEGIDVSNLQDSIRALANRVTALEQRAQS